LSDEQKPDFVAKIQKEQNRDRDAHLNKRETKPLLSIAKARLHRFPIEWKQEDIAKPSFIGLRTLSSFPLEEIVPFIDWTWFFTAFELKGQYPAILEDAEVGEAARELFEDAQKVLSRILARREIKANAVYGFYPANATGDDVELYRDDSRQEVVKTFCFLRQQIDKAEGRFDMCLSDFIAPRETQLADYLGVFAVTAGIGLDRLVAEYKKLHDDHSAFIAQALCDRLAEAFTELLHQRAREDWGFGVDESLSNDDLIREKYRGIRPAPGYPACPDLSEQAPLFEMLDAERRARITLTESFAKMPASSVAGFYMAHPQSSYFAVGKIGRDQMEDYCARKGVELRTIERILSPNLNYDPDDIAPDAPLEIDSQSGLAPTPSSEGVHDSQTRVLQGNPLEIVNSTEGASHMSTHVANGNGARG
jgi:5-methyltetrahydrofolate--homocysteine methyltransferase